MRKSGPVQLRCVGRRQPLGNPRARRHTRIEKRAAPNPRGNGGGAVQIADHQGGRRRIRGDGGEQSDLRRLACNGVVHDGEPSIASSGKPCRKSRRSEWSVAQLCLQELVKKVTTAGEDDHDA